jgi:hypothetical protein
MFLVVNGCMASSGQHPRSACPTNLDHTLGKMQQSFPVPASHVIFYEDGRGNFGESAADGKGSSLLAPWAVFPYKQVRAPKQLERSE